MESVFSSATEEAIARARRHAYGDLLHRTAGPAWFLHP